MTLQLDRSKPFDTTYGPDVALGMAFFQDGLYFKADGSLNETLPANVAVLAKRAKTVTVAAVETTAPPPDDLDTRSVSEIFKMAQELAQVMQEAGAPNDYAPTPGNKAGNIEFIRAHTE